MPTPATTPMERPTPDWREGLREVLQAQEATWSQVLGELLAAQADLTQVLDMRDFLVGHLDGAKPHHAARMQAMIGHIDRHLRRSGQSEATVEALAANVATLRDRLDTLERDYDRQRNLLAALVGFGNKRDVGSWHIAIGVPHLSVRVVDKTGLPTAYVSAQPDRKRILDHFKATGEVPPGVAISQTRPAVRVQPR